MNVLLIAAAAAATMPLRDPFWPAGYEGERRAISAELRYERAAVPAEEPKPAETNVAEKAEASQAQAEAQERAWRAREMAGRWSAALKTLRFGGAIKAQSADAKAGLVVLVNGRAYADGDLVRTDHEGDRFTWRVVKSDAERKLKLSRVGAVALGANKGNNK